MKMDDFEREHLRLFAQKIKDKIEELKNITGDCWICDKKTNFWIALLPEKEPDDLGIGIATGSAKTRVAFAPVCKEHNLEDYNIKKKLSFVLSIKAQKLKN